jgi:flavin reductase (DIM6/NTAB) family NADH-FMN oxidoreductase RutF
MPDRDSDLRRTMRQWATGVSLVTVLHRGLPRGMTVSSFTSLSLDPALVMVALRIGTRTEEWVRRRRGFAISILARDQQALAERFAGPEPREESRFTQHQWRATPSGHPIPSGCLAWLDCNVQRMQQVGTHRLIIARAATTSQPREAAPLLYFRQGYHSIAHE